MSSGEYVLLYDGTCGLCRHAARLIEAIGPRAPVRLVNAANPRELAKYPQVPPYQAMQSVHLLTPEGEIFRGYDAVVVLTALLPVLRWLVPVMRTRVARYLGWKFYEWVTHHRHQISRLLGMG